MESRSRTTLAEVVYRQIWATDRQLEKKHISRMNFCTSILGDLRFKASSDDTDFPPWAYPISLRTIPKPDGVRSPRFSVSAICHISPRTSDDSLVFSKNLTATSPVTTPILSESACAKSWPKYRRSSGLSCKFGCSRDTQDLAIDELEGEQTYVVDLRVRCRPSFSAKWTVQCYRHMQLQQTERDTLGRSYRQRNEDVIAEGEDCHTKISIGIDGSSRF